MPRKTAEYTWRTDGTSMTSRIRADYARTTAIIHQKYRAFADALPAEVRALQERCLAGMRAEIGPEGAYDCTIVLPVRDGRARTQRCLEAIARLDDAPTFEVVVVDDASSDDTPALLDTLGGDVQVLRNAAACGVPRSCNLAARAARGRHLVLLGPDVAPAPGWLAALVGAADADAEMVAVATDPAGTGQGAVDAHPLLVRRDAFVAAGGFDERRSAPDAAALLAPLRRAGARVVHLALAHPPGRLVPPGARDAVRSSV